MDAIEEDIRARETVPGTSYVVDVDFTSQRQHTDDSSIILYPQPSVDPNDPLNWSKFRKEYHFALVWMWAFILAAAVNWIGPVYTIIQVSYGATLNQMNITSGLCFLFLGVGCIVLQPLAMKFGRRPVYMLGTILNIIGNSVLAGSDHIGKLYLCNVLTGMAAAPVDSLVQISITDIFYLHEHGRRLSIYLFALYAGSYLGPVAAGYIYEGQHNWKWNAWWLIIISGGLLVVQYFSMDETLYKRDPSLVPSIVESQLVAEKSDDIENNNDEKKDMAKETNESGDILNVEGGQLLEPPPLKTYWQRLKLFSPEHGSNYSLIMIFWQPFPTIRYPAVIWCAIVYGIQICWLSLLGITEAEFFEDPPYNFSANNTGLINIASLIGGFFGMLYAGSTDYFQLWMTRRNQGFFEPEFRLWSLIIAGILNTGGMLMYGLGVSYAVNWVMPVFGIALISFGIDACGAIALTYAVDCYPEQASNTMVCILFIRNMLGTIFTWVFQYWLDGMGINGTTYFLAAICLVASMSFLIFIFWGKQFRRNTAAWYYAAIDKNQQ